MIIPCLFSALFVTKNTGCIMPGHDPGADPDTSLSADRATRSATSLSADRGQETPDQGDAVGYLKTFLLSNKFKMTAL